MAVPPVCLVIPSFWGAVGVEVGVDLAFRRADTPLFQGELFRRIGIGIARRERSCETVFEFPDCGTEKIFVKSPCRFARNGLNFKLI